MSLARVSTILAVLFVIAAGAIIYWNPANNLPAATDHAKQIDFLFKFMLVASAAVFLIVQGFLLYFVLRYRRRDTDAPDALGANIHGNTRLEIIWSVIPAVFLIVLTVMSFVVYQDIVLAKANAYTINVDAYQWGWKCAHPEYKITELTSCHMPNDREITINLHSDDVIHSFWVPEFRVKQDAVPGYPTRMHFKTERAGTYRLICAEFCGVAHSQMYVPLVVMNPADFAAWAKQQQQAAAASTNLSNVTFSKSIQPIFAAHCAACHISQQFGGLHLDNYAGLLKGGNIVPGPIITPKDHAKSILWEITEPKGPWPGGARMPLGGPYLSTNEINTIAAWIDQGAKNN